MRQKSPARRMATLVLVALVAATLLRVWDTIRSAPPPPEKETIERPELVRWEMPGCYAVRVEPWEFSARAETGFATPETPPFLIPPTRVRLLPDSTDRWRRSLTTYRAVPLTGDHDSRLGDYLRWVVRADTLWLLWSDGPAGGAIALRQVGDSLLGRARAFDQMQKLDGDALAAAWRIDCVTLERRSTERRPRR